MGRRVELRAWRAAWSALGQISPAFEPQPGGAYDRCLVDRLHRATFGRPPDLQNPKTHVEKMAWQKLFHKNPLMAICSDKVRVREYVRHLGLGDLLVPDVAVFRQPSDIQWDRLPDRFVLKPNHGSQWVVFCRDPKLFNRRQAVWRLNRWMRQNYSIRFAETNYRGIERRVLMEPFLGDLGAELQEHKFFCFHGEPKFISAIVGRGRGLVRQIYDPAWRPINMGSRGVQRVSVDIPRPQCYERMLEAARTLSEPFMHVRVDFMVAQGQPYLGELTFYNFGGIRPLEPDPTEEWVGGMWDLEASDELCARGRELADLLARHPG